MWKILSENLPAPRMTSAWRQLSTCGGVSSQSSWHTLTLGSVRNTALICLLSVCQCASLTSNFIPAPTVRTSPSSLIEISSSSSSLLPSTAALLSGLSGDLTLGTSSSTSSLAPQLWSPEAAHDKSVLSVVKLSCRLILRNIFLSLESGRACGEEGWVRLVSMFLARRKSTWGWQSVNM